MEISQRSSSWSLEGDDTDHPVDHALALIRGNSAAITAVRQQIQQYAQSDTSVFIYGETGTGKELVARALHAISMRADKAFVALNCGAYPNELILNELFGHERGAFTGAQTRQEGLIAQADGGTLFLDEIDSLSPAAQVVLLRFLQERSYRRLGSGRESKVDVRIIAATHCDLQERVADGRFRDDLFYRLDVLRIELPSLRERCEDILLLAHFYWKKIANEAHINPPPLTTAFEHWLVAYHWPGNIRELENVITRWVFGQKPASVTGALKTMSEDFFQQQGLIQYYALTMHFNDAKELLINQFEKHYVASILAVTQGNITQAARRAGKERRAFGRLAKKHQLI